MNISYKTFHVAYYLPNFKDMQIKYFGNDSSAAIEFYRQLLDSGNPSGHIYWTIWNVYPIDGK